MVEFNTIPPWKATTGRVIVLPPALPAEAQGRIANQRMRQYHPAMSQPVQLSAEQIQKFADYLAAQQSVQAFTFCHDKPGGDFFPDPGAPGVLDAFFFITAHQFGFWHDAHGRYSKPMIASIDGAQLKGSDFLFRCMKRAMDRDPFFFSPANLSHLQDTDWQAVFEDDHGSNPLPMWDVHLRIIREYTAWFQQHAMTPETIVAMANQHTSVLKAFEELVQKIPGYREDPLQKKLQLLAVILENRPEQFLKVHDHHHYKPIIDYHLQRSALRTGLVVIQDKGLESRIQDRELVPEQDEALIRQRVYDAILELILLSGKSAAAVDYFFFQNRKGCPEMQEPDCAACPVNHICAHRTDLFQPVFRTEAY